MPKSKDPLPARAVAEAPDEPAPGLRSADNVSQTSASVGLGAVHGSTATTAVTGHAAADGDVDDVPSRRRRSRNQGVGV